MPRPKKTAPNRADNRYEVKLTIVRTLDGKPIRKSFYSILSKEDAKAKADKWKIENQISQITGNMYNINSITFEEWATKWLLKYKKGNVKESTYKETYERNVNLYLIPYFGRSFLNNIRPIDVQSFFNKYSDIYSQTTLKKFSLCLNAIFETAILNDLCYKNPCKGITVSSKIQKQQKRTYSHQEVEEILSFADNHEYGLYIRILLELGLRCSELCGLKWSDFDLSEKTVKIQRACTSVNHKAHIDRPKSKNSIRTLPVSSILAERVEIEMMKMSSNNNRRFISKATPHENSWTEQAYKNNPLTEYIIESTKIKGKPLSPLDFSVGRYKKFFNDYVGYRKSKIGSIEETAKIPDVEFQILTPHELRHTCGTLLYDKTKDIYSVSKYLGHASVDITAKLYVHENAELLRQHLKIF